jgi:hypothetical protein
VPLFLFGLVKGAVKSVLVLALVAAAGISFAYYKVAVGKLPGDPGKVVAASVCRTTPSLSGGPLPFTFEAFIKDRSRHNWLQSGEPIGLVERRLEWSLSRFEWVDDAGFAARQVEARRGREQLARRTPDALIKDLRSEDAERREVAAKQLFVTTGQTLGYAYDAPADQRDLAATAWEKWWANDANRMRYGGLEALDTGQKALDLLRKALGTPAPEGTK